MTIYAIQNRVNRRVLQAWTLRNGNPLLFQYTSDILWLLSAAFRNMVMPHHIAVSGHRTR